MIQNLFWTDLLLLVQYPAVSPVVESRSARRTDPFQLSIPVSEGWFPDISFGVVIFISPRTSNKVRRDRLWNLDNA
jgi:hypothetical protein